MEYEIIHSHDLVELGSLISKMNNMIFKIQQNKSYNNSYSEFLRYSYLIKLRNDAIARSKELFEKKTIKTHL